ncbi:hypothetical protein [Actinomadura fibrosa]|uniref:Uncharacterized protein n=1 Tax=Actinomadura fibrosa TaxID=111802 RepID=A0ABW2XL67_9ACTN|nr:hypothetical protein [Actinomadura fibrosa]
MDADEPGRRKGGPRRTPASRTGRQPAQRRTLGRPAAPRRAGSSGGPRPERSGRRSRPAPPQAEPVQYDEPGYDATGYESAGYGTPGYEAGGYDATGYGDAGYGDQGYQDPQYQDAPYAGAPTPAQPYQDPGYSGGGYQDARYQDAGYQEAGYQDAGYQGGEYPEVAYEESGAADVQPAKRAPGRKGKAQQRGKGGAVRKGAKAPQQRPAKKGRGGVVKPPAASTAPPPPAAAPVPGSRPAGRAGKALAGPKLYFGAAGALGAVVTIGLAAVAVLGGGGDDQQGRRAPAAPPAGAAATGPSPASYSSSGSSAAYAAIAARTSDAAPLTEAEAFPESASSVSVPDGSGKLTLRAKKLDRDCSAAVWGATVAADLAKGGCTQAARTLYADTKRGYGLAVAVFNLAGSADADRFVETLDQSRGGGFVRPLSAPAPLASFGQGFGMARGLAEGHYAVVAWAQRLDGRGDETDETLLSLLIEGGKAPAVLGRAAGAGH